MHVNSDQGLELSPLYLGQILHCLTDEQVQNFQKFSIGVGHDFLVYLTVLQGHLGVAGPDHLDAQNTNLGTINKYLLGQSILYDICSLIIEIFDKQHGNIWSFVFKF